MDRKPIVAEEAVDIMLIKEPTTIKDLMPKYSYKFQSGEVSQEAEEMYKELAEFLQTNEELAVPSAEVSSEESYIKGFQRAVALTRLWIDSIYLGDKTEQP